MKIRILCDHNVHNKYVETFNRTIWIECTRVQDVLTPDAPDREISAYAAREGWVLFTEDDDFHRIGGAYGLIVYNKLHSPSPGVVVDAVERIADAYSDHAEIQEYVPGDWI